MGSDMFSFKRTISAERFEHACEGESVRNSQHGYTILHLDAGNWGAFICTSILPRVGALNGPEA